MYVSRQATCAVHVRNVEYSSSYVLPLPLYATMLHIHGMYNVHDMHLKVDLTPSSYLTNNIT